MEPAAVDNPPGPFVMRPIAVGVALTAIFYYFCFPPFPTSFFGWVALVPLLWSLETTNFNFAFRTGYLAGLFATGSLMFWLNSNSGATPFQATGMYLGAVMYLALWWGLFAVLQKVLHRRWGRKSFVAVPVLWTALDYLQSLGELGFTWHSLATGQTTYPYGIQYAEYTGMYGVTFWVVCLNVGFYFLWQSVRTPSGHRRIVTLSILLVMAAGAPFLHGLLTIPAQPTAERWIRVGIAQPNVEPNIKWLDRDFAYNELMKLTRRFHDDAVDLVIWPETAVPNRLRLDRRKLDPLREEIRSQGISLLSGFPDRRFVTTDDGVTSRSYNSVMLLNPASDTIVVYDKMHLVPFGEHIPSFLGFLAGIAMDVGDFGYASGNTHTVFSVSMSETTDTVHVAAVICLESIFPDRVRSFVTRGAELLVIVTNDAWYDGTFGPEQHARCAIYRAIEHRVSVARSANSGVSCLIDPYGRILAQTENMEQTVLSGRLPIPAERTFFTQFGNVFSYLMIAASIGLLILSQTKLHRA